MASDWLQINSAAAQRPQTCSQCHHDLYLQCKEEQGVLEAMVCCPPTPIDDRNIIDQKDLSWPTPTEALQLVFQEVWNNLPAEILQKTVCKHSLEELMLFTLFTHFAIC